MELLSLQVLSKNVRLTEDQGRPDTRINLFSSDDSVRREYRGMAKAFEKIA